MGAVGIRLQCRAPRSMVHRLKVWFVDVVARAGVKRWLAIGRPGTLPYPAKVRTKSGNGVGRKSDFRDIEPQNLVFREPTRVAEVAEAGPLTRRRVIPSDSDDSCTL